VKEIEELKLSMLEVQHTALKEQLQTSKMQIKQASKGLSSWMDVESMRSLEASFDTQAADGAGLLPCEDASLHFTVDDTLLLAISALGQVDSIRTYAALCTCEGAGLEGAWRGREAVFIVMAKDRHGKQRNEGGDVVEVMVQAPLATFMADVEDQADGTYLVRYTPTTAGEHCLSVTIRGKHTQWSPYFVQVRAGRDYSEVGLPLRTIGGMGDEAGRFNKPRGVAVDLEGRLLVADMDNHRVQIFRGDGTFIRSFGSAGVSNGRFNQPTGVVAGLGGHIMVTDRKNHRVQVFRADGSFVFKFGAQGASDGAFHHPAGIALHMEAAKIVVADKDNHRIQVFNPDGSFSHKFGVRGVAEGEFDWPTGVAVDQLSGTIFVADKNNHRIQVFDPSGGFVHMFGCQGNETGEFQFPWDVCVDVEGNIIVTEESGRIQVFQADGACIHGFGGKGEGIGKFLCPWGVAVGSDGQLVISDRHVHKVYIL